MCIRDSKERLNRLEWVAVGLAVAAIANEVIALGSLPWVSSVSYTHLRAHETVLDLVCRLLLEKKKKQS